MDSTELRKEQLIISKKQIYSKFKRNIEICFKFILHNAVRRIILKKYRYCLYFETI